MTNTSMNKNDDSRLFASIKYLPFIFILVLSVFSFTACERNTYTTSIESEKKFALEYGSFENETKLYSVNAGTDFFSGI